MADVSVVIATYERPDRCEDAIRAALAQTAEPLEVLVCDDGSSAPTRERLEALAESDERVRFLPLDQNTGTPGPARTLGVREAKGEWIAFCDDDDAWMPEKLARQVERTRRNDVDVIGTNALRSSDASAYFPDAPEEWRPSRADLLRDNPLIISSVLVRRDLLLSTGGFLTERWARGVADYGMWLALADAGARFVVLGEPLVRYDDAGTARMSAAPVRQELAAARLAARRWRAKPVDAQLGRAALAKARAAGAVAWHRAAAPLSALRRSAAR